MELVFVKRGTGLVQVGAESCPARMGDIFIVTPGTLHAPVSYTHLDVYKRQCQNTPAALN